VIGLIITQDIVPAWNRATIDGCTGFHITAKNDTYSDVLNCTLAEHNALVVLIVPPAFQNAILADYAGVPWGDASFSSVISAPHLTFHIYGPSGRH
jgi:hypothetical protein